jgi:ABC-type ATPase with predicted acetyltransferase domain
MALLNCRHCGNQVSSTAPLCPSCGGTYPGGVVRASIPAFILKGIFGVIAFIVFLILAR